MTSTTVAQIAPDASAEAASAPARSVLGNAALYTLGNIANSAIPFVLLPLLTRVLGPQEYGLIAIFTTLVTAFGAFAGLSVNGAVNVRFFDAHIDHPRYVGTAFALLALSTSLTVAAVLLGAPWLSGWTQLPAIWLCLAVVAAAAQFTISVRLVMWQVHGQAFRYGVFQVLQTSMNLGLSLVFIVGCSLGWQGRLEGLLAAAVLFAAIGTWTLQRTGQLQWTFDRTYARDALRFGVPLIPHILGSLLIAASDRLMVARLLSVSDAGVYAAGMQVGLVIGILAEATVRALGPWMFANLARNDPAVERKIVRVTYLYFAAIVLASLAFGALAPTLVLFVGEKFRATTSIVVYVALGGAFSGMYLMVVNYIFYAKRNELLALTSLCIGAANLAASYVLIGRHGAVGAAQAYAGSQLLMFLIVWLIAAKCRPMPWLSALRADRPAPQ